MQYGAHKMKFKSYIGLDVNKVCGINKYQKPGGFAAPGFVRQERRVVFETRRDRKIDRPGIVKSAPNVSGQERNYSIRKIVNAASDLHLLVLCETRKQG